MACTGSASLLPHNAGPVLSTRGNGLVLIDALRPLVNWRTSTSCKPIPPPSRDILTANCWSYMSRYCLTVSVFIGLSSASTSLALREALSISLMNSDSNSCATLRTLASLSRSPCLSALRRLRSV
ncbi:hypothetical protein D3C71_1846800 [compost metagenome]